MTLYLLYLSGGRRKVSGVSSIAVCTSDCIPINYITSVWKLDMEV